MDESARGFGQQQDPAGFENADKLGDGKEAHAAISLGGGYSRLQRERRNTVAEHERGREIVRSIQGNRLHITFEEFGIWVDEAQNASGALLPVYRDQGFQANAVDVPRSYGSRSKKTSRQEARSDIRHKEANDD